MQPSLFNSPLFTTIFSLVLLYAFLSLLASTITEWLNFSFKVRGKMLFTTIGKMFEDKLNPNFGQLLYDHPMIANLRKDRTNLPQYISTDIFCAAMVDVIGDAAREYHFNDEANRILLVPDENTNPFERCKIAIGHMKHTEVKLLLMDMIDKSSNEKSSDIEALALFQQQLKQWFNSQMDRVTGWYKTKTSVRLRWVAFVIAFALNIDSIHLFTALLSSPDYSQLFPGWSNGIHIFPDQLSNLSSLHWWNIKLLHISGLFITTYSISVGAPFWFDVLSKFVNLRKAGVKPETSNT